MVTPARDVRARGVRADGDSHADQSWIAGKRGLVPGDPDRTGAGLILRTQDHHDLDRHIAGQPTVVAQNMPGTGSLKAAAYLYEVAPKDGTALGVIVESAALEQALGNPAAQYDAGKFTYVGRVATS